MSVVDVILDFAHRYGVQATGALVILVAGVVIARWTGRLTNGWLERQATEPPLRILLVRVLRVVVLLFALVVALDTVGFKVAPLVAGIGVAGIGLGFALQGVLSNLMAGLTIIFTKPFRVGDYVAMLGVKGMVASIDLSSTTLVHADRSRVVIPNRKIVGEILHNFGFLRQLHLTVAVPHGADLEATLAALAEIVRRNPRVLKDPAPVIGITQVGDDSVKIGINPWVSVSDEGPAEAELYRAFVEDFRARRLPFGPPTREVRVLNGVASGAAALTG
jgi:small conductance mechanosensitive channel